jgi:hypothetical protein
MHWSAPAPGHRPDPAPRAGRAGAAGRHRGLAPRPRARARRDSGLASFLVTGIIADAPGRASCSANSPGNSAGPSGG